MTSGALIALFFVVLLVLMLAGIPIAYALGIASAGYMVMTHTSLVMVAQRMVNGANSFTMLAIPFFFMAGELMNISGVTDKIIKMARALVGHFKGGLAQVNIVASVFFAGVSGSATADTAALGATLIPKMVEEGYDLDFSAAITVASSCMGPIIPPSITLVLFGILSGTDVGKLLIAGIVPGIVIALTQMVYTHFYAKKMNYPSYPKATPKEMGKAATSGFTALMMPIIIIGGTLSGVFTPTEAAAVAVLYGIIMVVTLTFGGCTPPVGSMLFVVNSITKMGFARLSKAMLPLYIPLIIAILLITFVPQLSLFLPGLMK